MNTAEDRQKDVHKNGGVKLGRCSTISTKMGTKENELGLNVEMEENHKRDKPGKSR